MRRTGDNGPRGPKPFGLRAIHHAASTLRRHTRNTTERNGTRRPQTAPTAAGTHGRTPAPRALRSTTGRPAVQRARSLRSAALNSNWRSENTIVVTSRRGITTMSSAPTAGRSGSPARKTSRIRRLARLRSTAPPSRREATTPRRSTPRVFGRANRVKWRLATRRPCSCTATNSARERSRTCRPKDCDMDTARGARYVETVRRLRPFARRRARTIRPFFVLIRTRKP